MKKSKSERVREYVTFINSISDPLQRQFQKDLFIMLVSHWISRNECSVVDIVDLNKD